MTDARILRLNEQLKAFSGILFNLGAATIGAAATRVFLNGAPDWVAILWLFGSGVLIWLGAKLLGLMEVHDDVRE